jgi:hypothetical protein
MLCETEENGMCSVVMSASLVQGVRDGGKWKGFSGDMCWFVAVWGRRRKIDTFQGCCVLVC